MEGQRRTLRSALRVGSTVPVLRRLYRGHRRRLAVLLTASFLGGFAQAAVLVVLVNVGVGLAAGQSVLEGSFGPVGGFDATPGTLLLAAVCFLLVTVALEVLAAVNAARLSVEILARERTEAYRRWAGATWTVQEADRDGQLQELLSKNAAWSGTAVNSSTVGMVALCNLVALAMSAIVIEPVVAVVLAAGVGAPVLAARPLLAAARRRTEVLSERNVGFANLIARNVSLAVEVRTFDVADEVGTEVEAEIRTLSDLWFPVRVLNRMSPVLFRNAALALMIFAVLTVHLTGWGDLAALGAVVVIVLRGLGYASTVQRSLQETHGSVPWLEQLWDRVDHFAANPVPRGGVRLARIDSIRFRSVGFAYGVSGRGPRVLHGIDFAVDRGESIGIVGPSGAGKSTLVKLLLRLHDPTEGGIWVNGRPAGDHDLSDWYERVGYVPQHPVTFNASVADNIAFFRPGVSRDAVEEAARRAHLHDEILALPDGYDTPLGERTGRLSGGQRQRLAIARALLTDPDVVVLDEPTSALDMRSEAKIRETLEGVASRASLLVIAHRLSTLAVCQRILVLESGRLTALDTPERVRETNPFFREADRLARL